jgi:ArsR family transcriptional regulator
MKNELRLLKTMADENRLRLLLLLRQRELFVCQLMAVTGLSQPLVSRGLAQLEREGLAESRRQGKHVFYRLNAAMPELGRAVLTALDRQRDRGRFPDDRAALELFCRRFQKGRSCDMGMVKQFVAFRKQNQHKGA